MCAKPVLKDSVKIKVLFDPAERESLNVTKELLDNVLYRNSRKAKRILKTYYHLIKWDREGTTIIK